ncbi:MAG: hypothetical protein A2283_03670 [Lentisphaerae bacterium RIFOXYA12_FULL_48_11]|nr:MAG: hypothetical protein A2283_03670 [Lentisphaerae bacterium RIFOXYA12_FULL_48_11]
MTTQKQELTKERIVGIIAQGKAKSLTDISKSLGYKGSVSGSLSKKIKALVPEIDKLLKTNIILQELTCPATTPIPKNPLWKSPAKSPVRKCKYPRHPKNPYRQNSGYGLVFDILASHKDGLRRDQLVSLYSKASGKVVGKGASWDVAVIVSPDEDGSKHRSAKEGYYVEKGCGGFLKIHFR